MEVMSIYIINFAVYINVPFFSCLLLGVAVDEDAGRPAPLVVTLVLIGELDSEQTSQDQENQTNKKNSNSLIHLRVLSVH